MTAALLLIWKRLRIAPFQKTNTTKRTNSPDAAQFMTARKAPRLSTKTRLGSKPPRNSTNKASSRDVIKNYLIFISSFFCSHWGKNPQFTNSHFESLIFHKIHIFKFSFFTKFTFSKCHFSRNSHFQIHIFDKIHILRKMHIFQENI